jgi:hypothetical protein
MLEDTKKYIGAITSTKVENILYYIFKQGIVGNHGKNNVGGGLERPQKKSFEIMRGTKKDIMGVKNVNLLISEN